MLAEHNEIEHERQYAPLDDEYPEDFARHFLSYVDVRSGEILSLDGFIAEYEMAADSEGWPKLVDKFRYLDSLSALEFDNAVRIDWDRRVVHIVGFSRESR